MQEKIQRIPSNLERWFLSLVANAEEQCAQDGNRIGLCFWYEIGYLARAEFYYGRKE